MFYWIQTYLTRHFKWLIVILLAVLIVSFVFTIGNFSPLGGGGRRYVDQPFFGYDLSSEKDASDIFNRGRVSLSINIPFYADNPEFMQMYSLTRIALLHQADLIGLPGPSKEEFSAFVRSLPAFMDFSTQEFDESRYTAFLDSLSNSSLSEMLVTRVLQEDFKIDRMRNLLQGPGHMLPHEALETAKQNDTVWDLHTASLPYASFNPEVSPSREELESYFTRNAFRYLIPAKTEAGFLRFDPVNFIDETYQPDDGEKQIHFVTNKARYQADMPPPEPVEGEDDSAESPETPETPEVTLDQVEDKVIGELRLEKASKDAQSAAEEFAYYLFDQEIENGSVAFTDAIAAEGLELVPLEPYGEGSVASQMGLGPETLNQVFRLNESRYFSDPIQEGDQFVILIYRGRIPERAPTLDEVIDRVTADLGEEIRREKFVAKGQSLKEEIEAALEAGESFTDAASGRELELASFEEYKQSDPAPDGLNPGARNQLEGLEEGEVSNWVADPTNGTLVFAARKLVPDYTLADEPVQTVIKSQSRVLSSRNVDPIISELLDRELADTAYRR